MRCAWILPFLIACTGLQAQAPTTVRDSTGRTLRLVWQDEFEGTGSPDAAKWSREVGFIRNQELQYYTGDSARNAWLEGGHLVLETRRETVPNAAFKPGATEWKEARKTAAYSSACLITLGKASWTYGRFEVRARLPKGRGIWPAIWMLGENRADVKWPNCGEIDLMEMVGHAQDVVHSTVHGPRPSGADAYYKGGKLTVPGVSEGFHSYIVEWTADAMRFFVDDRPVYTYLRSEHAAHLKHWPFDKPHYLLINTAVGGTWGGQQGVDDAIFPQRFGIDYVRVYQ